MDLEAKPSLAPGDRVRDVQQEDDHYGYVVAESPLTAGEHIIDGLGESVSDFNGCEPQEKVFTVVFGDRLLSDLDSDRVYAYPRSRLESAPMSDQRQHALKHAGKLLKTVETELSADLHGRKKSALNTATTLVDGVLHQLGGVEYE